MQHTCFLSGSFGKHLDESFVCPTSRIKAPLFILRTHVSFLLFAEQPLASCVFFISAGAVSFVSAWKSKVLTMEVTHTLWLFNYV